MHKSDGKRERKDEPGREAELRKWSAVERVRRGKRERETETQSALGGELGFGALRLPTVPLMALSTADVKHHGPH